MNSDGLNPFKITNMQSVRNYMDFDVSPDGNSIIFCGNDGSDNEIFIINVDGTGLTNRTNNTADDVCPSWKPNGEWIAFLSNRDGGNYGLYVMKSDGTGSQRVGDYADVKSPYTPQWSPQGNNIAFVRYGNYLSADNYEIFARGESFLNISQNNKDDTYPKWSPNTNEYKIVFVSYRDGNFNIYSPLIP